MNFFKALFTAFNCFHAVYYWSLIIFKVLNLLIKDLCHHFHVKHLNWLDKGNSVLQGYISIIPYLEYLLIGQMYISSIRVQFGSFSFDFFFGLWRYCLAFRLFSTERAFFAPLRHVVSRLAILWAWVTTDLWSTAMILAAALWDPLRWLGILISTHHIVVRVIVRFFAILVPHFQVIYEFILANFAIWVFYRLHGSGCGLSTNSSNILTPLSLSNITLRIICRDWPLI